jgi:hypothetical protein
MGTRAILRGLGAAMVVLELALAQAWSAEEPKPDQDVTKVPKIRVDVGKGPYVFGAPVKLHITYRNDSTKAWTLKDPAGSLGVRVSYRIQGSTGRQQGFFMRDYEVAFAPMSNGQVMTTWVVPQEEEVTLAPHATREFDVRVEKDWTGNVVPGRWEVWVADEGQKLESNHLEISLRFMDESIKTCLAVARDKSENRTKRKWHGEWLQKIDPALQLQWPDDNASVETRATMERAIQKALTGFEAFLVDEKNGKAIEEAIRAINREAKVDETAASKPADP